MKVIWFIVLLICIIGIIYNIDRLNEVVTAEQSAFNRLLFGDVIETQKGSAGLWLLASIVGGVISIFGFIRTSGNKDKEE